ncbi:MAG TPA: hypothetical protein VGM69_24040 [Chloroflexota bacterium]
MTRRSGRAAMGDTIRFSVPDNFPIVYQEDHEALRPLRGRGEVRLFSTRHGSPEELVERLRGARAAINVRAYSKFTDETFAALPELRFVVNPAVLTVAR